MRKELLFLGEPRLMVGLKNREAGGHYHLVVASMLEAGAQRGSLRENVCDPHCKYPGERSRLRSTGAPFG